MIPRRGLQDAGTSMQLICQIRSAAPVHRRMSAKSDMWRCPRNVRYGGQPGHRVDMSQEKLENLGRVRTVDRASAKTVDAAKSKLKEHEPARLLIEEVPI